MENQTLNEVQILVDNTFFFSFSFLDELSAFSG